MGGFGSGNREKTAERGTVDRHRALDIRVLYREGSIVPGKSGRIIWHRDGRQAASIGWSVVADDNTPRALEFRYSIRSGNAPAEDIQYRVWLTYTPCNYGGVRPWFICPGITRGRRCNRSVALLYFGARYFLCRHCQQLAYESQRETSADRAQRRSLKIRQQLGGDPIVGDPFPEKPPLMHWRTYRKLRGQAMAAEWEDEQDFLLKALRVIARGESRQQRKTARQRKSFSRNQ